jgi:sporulation protein YlmC with PRC-barrel domain
MSARELPVSRLLGRRVRDLDGRAIGRIEELICAIELREQGRDYVVRELRVGTLGTLDAVIRSPLLRRLFRLVRGAAYVRHDIPWDWMDLADPTRPRILRTVRELRHKAG